MHPLGKNAERIESEYLERLNKVRFGLDWGYRPPGLILKGGTTERRGEAIDRLKSLAEADNFFCSSLFLTPDLQLRDREAISRAAIEAARMSSLSRPDSEYFEEVKRLAGIARESKMEGWVLLIDNVDAFRGTTAERAESYGELSTWMGRPPGDSLLGLTCVISVTSDFERSVEDPADDLTEIGDLLGPAGPRPDTELLDNARLGINAIEHEILAHELLVLE